LVAEAVTEVRPHGVVTADGREHEVDTIIWGTGFNVTEMPAGKQIRGRGGRLLGDVWREGGLQALRGTTVAGFPNLFLLVGPNTLLGHNSVVFIIESQLAYVIAALRAMEAQGAGALDTRAEAQAAYNEMVQRRMRGTVWVDGGCASWYIDEHGRNTTLWPGTSWSFRKALRRFDPAEHLLESDPLDQGARPEAAAAAHRH
jgi:cation diffusion facilitator CzcD-associated flavoprotein CzcO